MVSWASHLETGLAQEQGPWGWPCPRRRRLRRRRRRPRRRWRRWLVGCAGGVACACVPQTLRQRSIDDDEIGVDSLELGFKGSRHFWTAFVIHLLLGSAWSQGNDIHSAYIYKDAHVHAHNIPASAFTNLVMSVKARGNLSSASSAADMVELKSFSKSRHYPALQSPSP
jgi:hypothetical protein